MAHLHQLRLRSLIALAFVIPLGLGSKTYNGPAATWVEGYSGDILYELAWMFLIAGLWPALIRSRQNVLLLAVSVFGVTSVFEFLQLWQPAWLQALRATLLGKLILGTTFVPLDFLYYALGCLMGAGILLLWRQQLRLSAPQSPH